MKPAPFAYHDPSTVDELMGLLAERENARLLAGGQSLMPMLNMRYAMPDHLIDLNGVGELAGVAETAEAIEIGAMTRQCDLLRSAPAAARFPILAEALGHVGHFQTRNRGTVGGSLCHLDPSAELPCVAAAADAVLTVRGRDGEREVAMADWPAGYMTPGLAADEALIRIRLPASAALDGQAFVEFARRHGDFAIVGVAAMLSLANGTIRRASLAVAGVGPHPVRLAEIEAALAGEPANEASFRAASGEARGIEAMSDAYVSARYRQRLTGVLVERALAKAAERAREAA